MNTVLPTVTAVAGVPARARERAPRLGVVSVGVASVVVLLAGLATALLAGGDDLPADGARVHLDGRAIVDRGEGAPIQLEDGDVVRAGDVVTVTDGTAVLELAAGGSVEGRAGRNGAADTTLALGDTIGLIAGDALLIGPSGLAVEAAGTVLTLDADGTGGAEGAARVSRQLAVSTATYQGTTLVESAGQRREVRALRQLDVASVGRPSSGEDPLRYDADDLDPWDLRFLGGAIDLTRRLDALSRSLTAQGITRIGAQDFTTLLPRLADEPAFGGGLLDNRVAGETLVGAAITSLGDRGEFQDRWSEVFGFRDAGATWGLVALDQQVGDGPLLDDVQQALSISAGPVGGNLAAVDTSPTTPDQPAPSTTSPPSSTSSTTPGPSTTTLPPPTLPPGTTLPPTEPTLPPTEPTLPPPPDEGDDLLGELVDPVTDLLGGLIGGG